jgi:hypothetical protein
METIQEHSFFKNYALMAYTSILIFNMIDIAPFTHFETFIVAGVIFFSAIYNA